MYEKRAPNLRNKISKFRVFFALLPSIIIETHFNILLLKTIKGSGKGFGGAASLDVLLPQFFYILFFVYTLMNWFGQGLYRAMVKVLKIQ